MSSKWMIKINYQRSLHQAEQLDTLAGQIKKVGTTELNQAKSAEAAGWKGENEAAMRKKTERLQENVKATAKSLKNIASTIRTIATDTYNAEMRAWEIAHRRTYGG